MKSWPRLAAIFILLFTVTPVSGDQPPIPEPAWVSEERSEDEVVFEGVYDWVVDGHQNYVEAVFLPKGDGLWDVAFNFKYARRQDTYKGKAQGSVENGGSIRGEVKDGNGIVRYRVEAKIEGDRLEGKHYEIGSGEKRLSGTLSLARRANQGS